MLRIEKILLLQFGKSGLFSSLSSHYKPHIFNAENHFKVIKKNNTVSVKFFSLKLQTSQDEYYNDMRWSLKKLEETSRSFGALIKNLPNDLKNATSLFYLILRALDTIEDDVNLTLRQKIDDMRMLLQLLQNSLTQIETYTVKRPFYSENDLLKNIHKLLNCIHKLHPDYSKIISETAEGMRSGMELFLNRPIKTIDDLDSYCHYVAGLVGIGLSKMWVISGLEKNILSSPQIDPMSNSMGLFLQKTNIIRDCYRDFKENRAFIPEEIWKKHSSSYADIFAHKNKESGLMIINNLIFDAFRHLEESIEYLKLIQNPHIFKFCAIPQVMAASTLALCFNNSDVLEKNVKISKYESYKMFYSVDNMEIVCDYYDRCINLMKMKILSNDSNSLVNKYTLEKLASKVVK